MSRGVFFRGERSLKEGRLLDGVPGFQLEPLAVEVGFVRCYDGVGGVARFLRSLG